MKRLLVLIVVPALLACALLESPAPPPTYVPAATTPTSPVGGLTNDDSTFSYDSLIGKLAPAFTATDANAQPYMFTPNDGRKHVIVFNMGFAWGLCVSQLGELEKRMGDLKPLADVIAVGADTASSIQQTQSATKASFPLLRDPDLKVSKLYDMQLRSQWPMGMMGAFPEMGYVIVDDKGIIRTQRVDLTFGDHADEMIILLKRF